MQHYARWYTANIYIYIRTTCHTANAGYSTCTDYTNSLQRTPWNYFRVCSTAVEGEVVEF